MNFTIVFISHYNEHKNPISEYPQLRYW